jgi:hypothetical protein
MEDMSNKIRLVEWFAGCCKSIRDGFDSLQVFSDGERALTNGLDSAAKLENMRAG